MYLLDTNIISDIIRRPFGPSAVAAEQVEPGSLLTSIVVACELRFGATRRGSPDLVAKVDGVLDRITVVSLGVEADAHYARLRTDLERRGLPIGANDLFIAAHALSLGATLVTDNTREFERVDGLTVENWLRPI